MENETELKSLNRLDRGIFWFYEWGLKYVPAIIMLCHWYGVWDFHNNPREILLCIKENEPCIAYLYFMTYVFPVMFMLPASLFYGLCWIYRLPFAYAIGVSVIRIFYESWLITNEMEDVDFILIFFMMALYVYAFVTRQSWRVWRLFRRK